MTTDSFIAERQPNGDVWIRTSKHYWRQSNIVIPKDKCDELAMLLLRDAVTCTPQSKLIYTGAVPSPDYTRGIDEPE